MKKGKIAVLVAAAALPVSALGAVVTAGVAGAGGTPDAGSITCGPTHTTVTLSTPYTPGGTPGVKKTTTSVPASTFSGCSATLTAGSASGGSSAATAIKQKVAKGTNASNCQTALGSPVGGFKLKVTWNDGTKSKIVFTGGSGTASPPGFVENGSVASGSFAGDSVTITAALDGPTLTAMAGCVGGNPTPIGTLGLNTTIAIS